jgi:uncharacterized protein
VILLVEDIKKEVIKSSEEYKKTSEDNYDFWKEHVKYVYEESIKLAEIYGADKQVVELGALLHDIALIKQVGKREEHHINGANIAREMLEKYNCPKELLEKVVLCVYNHRSSKNAKSIEEVCVADADIIAHFYNIPMLFNSAYNRSKVNLSEAKEWVKNCFEKDFNDLSDDTKKLFKEKYENIYEIVIGK